MAPEVQAISIASPQPRTRSRRCHPSRGLRQRVDAVAAARGQQAAQLQVALSSTTERWCGRDRRPSECPRWVPRRDRGAPAPPATRVADHLQLRRHRLLRRLVRRRHRRRNVVNRERLPQEPPAGQRRGPFVLVPVRRIADSSSASFSSTAARCWPPLPSRSPRAATAPRRRPALSADRGRAGRAPDGTSGVSAAASRSCWLSSARLHRPTGPPAASLDGLFTD